ncbi:MAG: pyrroloquinoline quinone-dependent dehydrogenase [Gammaproteobacteria bacterium]|nr:pyrroloquinoline quinone-dependent dehydrogenase [Gammaproteobacteria bacterium]
MNQSRHLSAIALSILLSTAAYAADSQWPTYAGNKGGQQYADLDQINTDNVGQLEIAWQYRTGELVRRTDFQNATAKTQVNPILLPAAAGGHLMTCTPFNRIIALDPTDGTERWVYDPAIRIGGYGSAADPQGLASPSFANCRGVAYWKDESLDESAACRHRILTATNDLRLIAIDARSGELCKDFGHNGSVNIEADVLNANPPATIGEVRFANPPSIINDIAIIGSSVRDNHRYNAPSGAIRAFDLRTGTPRWTFDPVPRDLADPMHGEWLDNSANHTGGANAWGLISVDEQRDLVFLPTSGPSPDFYGGTRPGDNRYADSIVALRGSTGKVVWHFQTIHHDVWDYDNAAQPTLIDLEKDGEPFPAVIQATKTGMLYIFHRETGEPFFPIEERPVPQDGVPGEHLSPTQPFPVRPPPLVPHDFGPDDFWGITFFDKAQCKKKYAGARLGPIFTPPSIEGTVIVPATAGGINWGGVAVEPRGKILIAKAMRMAHFAQLIPLDKLSDVIASSGENLMGTPAALIGTPYALKQGPFVSPMFTPCLSPPWSALVAVDLSAGEILWQSTLGTLDTLVPVPLPLKWGTASLGGPIITAGGLVFIGATQDDRIRAFDIVSGEQLWEFKLPAGAFAMPMTYAIDGRQFIVIASGGHPFIYPFPGDYITAFALPTSN